jgi:hypothetical protein
MKIAIASDLHLEFGDLDFDNSESAQVLILSGDILVAKDVVDQDVLVWQDQKPVALAIMSLCNVVVNDFRM